MTPADTDAATFMGRSGVATWMRQFITPVETSLDERQADATADEHAAHYTRRGAAMESVTRPLWGLVPWLVGGGTYPAIARWREAIAHGVDPDHPAFWGMPGDLDQRWVEACILGVALAWAPEHIWTPLPAQAKDHLADWLSRINTVALPQNNWLFFRIMANLGLRRVGRPHDPTIVANDFGTIESFYLGDGWYQDGATEQRDYYISTAMHFYGLLYAALAGADDPERTRTFRRRAEVFAPDYATWFASDGASIPYGRSLTYRFAAAAFWPALALAGATDVDWAIAHGIYARHLAWWSRQPMTTATGHLSVGFAYPNSHMSEQYNAAGSPYWAFKAFAALAVPEDHPFWTTPSAPLPTEAPPRPLPHARMLTTRVGGHARCLSAGQWAEFEPRHTAAKYAKFASCSALGFSVPVGTDRIEELAPDSMLALSEDGRAWRVRRDTTGHAHGETWCVSSWQPWADVTIRTWLIAIGPWQVRVHRVVTGRAMKSAEGGWAIPRQEVAGTLIDPVVRVGPGVAVARGDGWSSAIHDLLGQRCGQVRRPLPNTNLIHRHTVLPMLEVAIEPGITWMGCAVRADAQDTPADQDPPVLDREPGLFVLTSGETRIVLPDDSGPA